jgi:hypothetical protein
MSRLLGLVQSGSSSLRFSSRLPKLSKQIWLLVGLAATVTGACSKDKGDEEATFGPAVLEILGAQNTAGQEFEPDDSTITLACDQRLTFHVGPHDVTPGLLKNWNLRPPGTCPSNAQCGYLRYQLVDAEGNTLLQSDQANIAPVLDLSSIEIGEISSFVALLMDGTTAEPYLQDDAQVSDSWSVRVESGTMDCEDPGTGGSASGSGGTDGTGGDQFGGMGGLGGLGGATGG